MRVLVTGATGHVGRHLVSSLDQRGIRVRALSRKPSRWRVGIEAAQADLSNVQSLEPHLHDVDALFLLWPGSGDVEALVQAASKYVPRITAVAAHPVDQPALEAALKRSGSEWTVLRSAALATETLRWAPPIREGGIVRLRCAFARKALVHEEDLADVAAEVLTTGGHAGRTYFVSGPEHLSDAERVKVIGTVLGREVEFESVDDAIESRSWGDLSQGVEVLSGARSYEHWVRDHASDFC